MTDPMRNDLRPRSAKKGVYEAKERFVKLPYPLVESQARRWLRPISQSVYIRYLCAGFSKCTKSCKYPSGVLWLQFQ